MNPLIPTLPPEEFLQSPFSLEHGEGKARVQRSTRGTELSLG